MHLDKQIICHYSGLPSVSMYSNETTEVRGKKDLLPDDKDRIIQMAWEDRTPFDAINIQFGLNEAAVKALMKKTLRFSSYKVWRKRVEDCQTKHLSKRQKDIGRFKSDRQRAITGNHISKKV